MNVAEHRGIAWAALALVLGCQKEAPPPTPSEGCEQLMVTFCAKKAACGPAASFGSAIFEDCMMEQKLAIICDRVRHLGSSFDACIEDIGRARCQNGAVAPPESCTDALDTKASE